MENNEFIVLEYINEVEQSNWYKLHRRFFGVDDIAENMLEIITALEKKNSSQ
jgi:hypothetical protein